MGGCCMRAATHHGHSAALRIERARGLSSLQCCRFPDRSLRLHPRKDNDPKIGQFGGLSCRVLIHVPQDTLGKEDGSRRGIRDCSVLRAVLVLSSQFSVLSPPAHSFRSQAFLELDGHALELDRQLGWIIKIPSSTIKFLSSTIKTQSSTIKTRSSTVKTRNSTIKFQSSTIRSPSSTTKTRSSTTKTRSSTIKPQNSTIKSPEFDDQVPELNDQVPELNDQDSQFDDHDSAFDDHDSELDRHDSEILKTPPANLKNHPKTLKNTTHHLI